MLTKTDSPLVSVIAVSYNHERWLLETLESIKAQTFRDFELIYADDASSDRSAQTALSWLAPQSFPVTTIIHEKNRGLCATLNEALSHCRGRYLQLIACDDVLLPEKLAVQVPLLEATGPDVALVHARLKRIDAEGQPLVLPGTNDPCFPTLESMRTDVTFERLLQGDNVFLQSGLIKREAVHAVGGYDERLSFEDFDLFLRLSLRYRLISHPEVTVAYRVLSSSLTRHLNPSDHYWIVRKYVKCADARACLKRFAYWLYVTGKLSNEVRRDFLECLRQYPDMRMRLSDLRTLYNGAIRMRVPAAVLTPVKYGARGLKRFARALRRAPSA